MDEPKTLAEVLQEARKMQSQPSGKLKEDHALPTSCSMCVYYREQESRCHRRAPSPGEAVPGGQFLFSYWTEVSPNDRCGDGADRRKPGEAALVMCVDCMYWWQPGDVGLQPKYPMGRTREEWAQSGYCVRRAPYPTSDQRRKAAWIVKHAAECCGDGVHFADAVGGAEDELADENI